MGLPLFNPHISLEEYLEGEKISPVRHEYVDGEVYAMAGASKNHHQISSNLYIPLTLHLKKSPCKSFIFDMKLKVSEKLVYYPDLMVACDPPGSDPYYCTQPKLIIEVLSPNTERTDRHEKMLAYFEIPTLQEYVLISQQPYPVELYRRRSPEWIFKVFKQAEEELELESIGLKIPLAQVYEGVEAG